MADGRVTQAVALVLADAAGGDARVTQVVALAGADAAGGDARITQVGALVAHQWDLEARLTQFAALPLVSFDLEARVTQLAALVLAEAVPCATQWAQIWRLEARDGPAAGGGLELRYTTFDQDLTWLGKIYTPCASLVASATETAAIMGAGGSMEAVGLLDDAGLTEDDLYNGRWDGATVEVWIVPWAPAAGGGQGDGEIAKRLMFGTMGEIGHDLNTWKGEIVTQGSRLQEQPLVQVVTPTCRFALGDARCARL